MYSESMTIERFDPDLARAIAAEQLRQEEHIELIASENYASPRVLAAQGSVLTNKYAEGYPGKRYYGGCEVVDVAETLAINRAKELFGADAVNVQAHSGSQANMGAFMALMKTGDTMLSLDLNSGGHLTHGAAFNFSGKLYKVVHYGLTKDAERIDYAQMAALAREHKPKLILAGASAYSRIIDFDRFAEIAREVGAPAAVRAVAMACGANALAVAIPCHRVVRTDGALSGYRWGVERKRTLLEREAL